MTNLKKDSFKDIVAVITGGAKGIGFEDAKLFSKLGAKVAICDISKTDLKNAEKELSGKVFAKIVDVRKEKEIRKFAKEVITRFGKIDILVNNAGILPRRDNFSEQSFSVIDNVVDTNLKGILYMTGAVVNHMISRKSGVIINMSSEAGIDGYAEMAIYSATKFGIRGFSKSLGEELSGHGIKVYSICPGAVKTDLNAGFTGQPAEGIPPEEVAKLIAKIALNLPEPKDCFRI